MNSYRFARSITHLSYIAILVFLLFTAPMAAVVLLLGTCVFGLLYAWYINRCVVGNTPHKRTISLKYQKAKKIVFATLKWVLILFGLITTFVTASVLTTHFGANPLFTWGIAAFAAYLLIKPWRNKVVQSPADPNDPSEPDIEDLYNIKHEPAVRNMILPRLKQDLHIEPSPSTINICIWLDRTWCRIEEIETFLTEMASDYDVVAVSAKWDKDRIDRFVDGYVSYDEFFTTPI